MSEQRGTVMAIYIEPTLMALAENAAKEDGSTISTWGRQLVIEALMKRGALTDAHIRALFTGETVRGLRRLQQAQAAAAATDGADKSNVS